MKQYKEGQGPSLRARRDRVRAIGRNFSSIFFLKEHAWQRREELKKKLRQMPLL